MNESIKTFERIEEAVSQFEKQFNVEAKQTGYEEESEDIAEREYWTRGLINSEAESLEFEVGGWFRYDKRNGNLYCSLAIKLNNENIEEMKMLHSWYDEDKEKWGELKWETI